MFNFSKTTVYFNNFHIEIFVKKTATETFVFEDIQLVVGAKRYCLRVFAFPFANSVFSAEYVG